MTAAIVPRSTLLLLTPLAAFLGLSATGGGAAAQEGEPAAIAAADTPAAIPAEVLRAEKYRMEVLARIAPTVVAIFSPSGAGGGSGVLISPDGYALTNFHVAYPDGPAAKCGLSDGKLYDAVLVGVDPVGDVALVKLLGRDDFPYAELGDSDQVQPGDEVYVLGNPFMLAADFQPSVSVGIISGVHRYQYPAGTLLEYADCLQTDAAINPGNSGGPLFDAAGRLIGINGRAAFEKRGRINVGVGFAISINQIKNYLGHLHGGRIVDHATLGAVVASDADGRVVVSNILTSSDAYRRGLRYDDEVVRLAGRLILSPNDFKNVLGTLPKGWRVPLSFRRGGQRFDVLVRLAGVHSEAELLEKLEAAPPVPPMSPPGPDRPGRRERSGQPEPAPELPADPSPEQPPNPARPQLLGPGHLPTPPLPEVVRQHYEARRGYANYYFNRLHQQRLWEGWRNCGAAAGRRDTWRLQGRLPTGTPCHIELDDAGAQMEVAGRQIGWQRSVPVAQSLVPEGSGGLLPALYLWRRLAAAGLDSFGEVYYLGREPLPGQEAPVDVLVGLFGGAECHFFFHPGEGELLAIEMYGDPEADPCEVYFQQYRRQGDFRWPAQIEVRFGDQAYGVLVVDRVELLP